MLTRTFFITSYPNTNSQLRAVLNLQGEGTIVGTLTILNIEKYLLPITIGVRIGDKHAVFQCNDSLNPFSFNMVADINSSIIVALGSYSNNDIISIGAVNTDNIPFDNSIYIQPINKEIKEIDDYINTPINNQIQIEPSSVDIQSDTNPNTSTPSDDTPSFSLFQQLLNDTHNSQDNSHLFQDYSECDTFAQKENQLDSTPEHLNIDNVLLGDNNFYNLISPQLNQLFANYPRFAKLENIVENTEWIKVSYTDNGEGHYVLGKLYDNGIVSLICYGIPSPNRLTPPPAEIIEYCQWLPLNLDDVDGEGYWVMYQSAETGENYRL